MNLTEKTNQFKGRSFEFEKKRFDVTDVRCDTGRAYIYTLQERTFVKDSGQLDNFLLHVKFLPVGAEPEPKNNQNTKPMTQDVSVVNTSVQTADDMTSKMKQMFDVLSDKPTEEDFKKAEGMTKIANAIISVEQTKINYLKLKDQLR